MNVIAIVQARMGSTRLPGKMTMELGGKPAIAHVFERAARAKKITDVWLATTNDPKDDVLAAWAKTEGVNCFRGSEQDVLDRYYQCAKQAHADVIVRLTADCPLIDPYVVDQVIEVFLESGVDFACNTQPPTYPDGLDTEVFSFAAFEKAWKEATLASEREHVTPYLWKHTELFTLKNVSNDVDYSSHRWTLDTQEDLEFLRLVVDACMARGGVHGFKEILALVAAHPEWQAINAKYQRNEGYAKSVAEDHVV